ncbi:MAG: hypothetical protein K8L97_17295 [Anaerolineae bacterium]|nr:hypothetical protein [Anaerolineae bacterium]
MPGESRRRFASWAGMMIALVVSLGEIVPTLLLILMPILLFFTGILYGVDCALRISAAIAREHENNTYHLLSLAPPGPLGVSWAICTSALYRNREFDRFHIIVRTSIVIALVIVSIVAGLTLMWQSAVVSRFPQPTMLTVLHFINLVCILVAIYIEYVQSAVLGCIVGMLIPTYADNRLDAGLYALGVFLLLQITAYFLTVLIGFSVLTSLYQAFTIGGFYAEISLTIARVILFFTIREGLIVLTWRILIERLNGRGMELA